MISPARLLPWLSALALPMLVQVVWVLHNTQLPISDSTGSLLAAHRLAGLALNGQWGDFIAGLYLIRDWRPTALCLVEMPFCLISGGNLMFTAAALTLTSTAVSVTYIYRLLRLALPQKHAALAAALLGLMPVVQWPATFFGFTEAPFLATCLAGFYYLLRAPDFTSRKSAFCMAAAMSLGFMLRPVEAALHFTPLLAFCAWRACKRGSVSGSELYTSLTVSCLCASVLALAGWWPHGLMVFPESEIFGIAAQGRLFMAAVLPLLLLTLFLVLFFFLRRLHTKLARCSYFLSAIIIVSLVTCLWYLHFMTPLVQWIYITNLGELSNITAPRTVWEKMVFFAGCIGVIPFLVITALSLGKRGGSPLLPLLAVLPLPLITPFFTCQYSERKMTVVFTCLLLVLLARALHNATSSRLSLVALLAACQCAGVAWISTGHSHDAKLEPLIGLRLAYPDMVTLRPNPHDTLVSFMQESAQRYGYHSISLPILAGDFVPRLADPFLLHILMEMKDPQVDASIPHITVEDAGEYRQPQRLFGADAFLLLPDRKLHYTAAEAEEFRTLSAHAFLPSDRSAYGIMALHAQHRLEAPGVHKRICRVIAPSEVEACIYDYGK